MAKKRKTTAVKPKAKAIATDDLVANKRGRKVVAEKASNTVVSQSATTRGRRKAAADDAEASAAKPKRAKKVAAERAAKSAFPMMERPPLPSELRGELPEGQTFDTLAVGAPFRYRGAVERGFNELWEKRDDARYSTPGAPATHWYPAPEGARVLPA